MHRRLAIATAAGLLAAPFLSRPVQAARHVVRMVNFTPDGQVMVFDPMLVRANVGDSVVFELVDQFHNAQAADGMWPQGAPPFLGQLNETVTLTITHEGVHGIVCAPHYAAGMVGLVVAGRPVNLAASRAVQHPELAQARFTALLERAAQPARLDDEAAALLAGLPAAWREGAVCATPT
jgi:pseudoazurin